MHDELDLQWTPFGLVEIDHGAIGYALVAHVAHQLPVVDRADPGGHRLELKDEGQEAVEYDVQTRVAGPAQSTALIHDGHDLLCHVADVCLLQLHAQRLLVVRLHVALAQAAGHLNAEC